MIVARLEGRRVGGGEIWSTEEYFFDDYCKVGGVKVRLSERCLFDDCCKVG